MVKQTTVHPYRGILFSIKNELSHTTAWMDLKGLGRVKKDTM